MTSTAMLTATDFTTQIELPRSSSSSSASPASPVDLFDSDDPAMLPWIDTDLSSLGMLGSSSNALDSAEKVYAFRPSIPPTPEEASDMILEKLEQAGRVPSKDKFRRMACNTFIFTGACPYNDRCVFLHDFRIKAEGVKVRTTRQTRSNSTIKDTFYWPDMTRKDIIRNTDAQGLPSANQIYIIPDIFRANPGNYHNRGLYSVWAHFVEFCVHNAVFYSKKYRDVTQEPFFQTSAYRENPHIPGAKRLDVFIQLSMGIAIRGSGSRGMAVDEVRIPSSSINGPPAATPASRAAPVRRATWTAEDWESRDTPIAQHHHPELLGASMDSMDTFFPQHGMTVPRRDRFSPRLEETREERKKKADDDPDRLNSLTFDEGDAEDSGADSEEEWEALASEGTTVPSWLLPKDKGNGKRAADLVQPQWEEGEEGELLPVPVLVPGIKVVDQPSPGQQVMTSTSTSSQHSSSTPQPPPPPPPPQQALQPQQQPDMMTAAKMMSATAAPFPPPPAPRPYQQHRPAGPGYYPQPAASSPHHGHPYGYGPSAGPSTGTGGSPQTFGYMVQPPAPPSAPAAPPMTNAYYAAYAQQQQQQQPRHQQQQMQMAAPAPAPGHYAVQPPPSEEMMPMYQQHQHQQYAPPQLQQQGGGWRRPPGGPPPPQPPSDGIFQTRNHEELDMQPLPPPAAQQYGYGGYRQQQHQQPAGHRYY